MLAERLSDLGADIEEAQWDSRKRADGSWQVSLVFTAGGRPRLAEWVFDPRSRHVSPANDTAAAPLPARRRPAPHGAARQPGSATVTPIGSRLGPGARRAGTAPAGRAGPRPRAAAPGRRGAGRRAAGGAEQAPAPERPARKKAAGGRSRRSSVPSWDEIMFGTSRQPD